MAHILKCEKCGNYGLTEQCSCGSKKVLIKPAKYNPEDKYAKYRRMAKQNVDDNEKQEN